MKKLLLLLTVTLVLHAAIYSLLQRHWHTRKQLEIAGFTYSPGSVAVGDGETFRVIVVDKLPNAERRTQANKELLRRLLQTVVAVKQEQGEATASIKIAQDVTVHKKIETRSDNDDE